jgi:hypothetical protein
MGGERKGCIGILNDFDQPKLVTSLDIIRDAIGDFNGCVAWV